MTKPIRQLAVNYVKLDKVPLYNESWAPIIDRMQRGDFFGTTGEVLFHQWGVEGSGAKSVYSANIEYTYPLEFADLVWSDGTKVEHKYIDLTDTTPFGTKEFRIPFDATRQEVGSVLSVGFGGKRCVGSAGQPELGTFLFPLLMHMLEVRCKAFGSRHKLGKVLDTGPPLNYKAQ